MYEFKSRTKVTDFKALSNTSFLDAYDLPYKHKVFVAGNHDMCMYGADKVEGLPDDIHYLCNSGVVIKSLRDLGHAISELADMDGYYDSFNIDVNGNCGVFEVKFS